MAEHLKIEINIIYSPPDTDAKEFNGAIIKSRNDAIMSAMNEVSRTALQVIPADSICSVVLGSKVES